MRKTKMQLIKRTEEWRHRKSGSGSISLPEGMSKDKLRYFKLLGNSKLSEDGTLLGVGNYDEETGSYSIGIHVHGLNLISGKQFADIHFALGLSNTTNPPSETVYNAKPYIAQNGTIILDKNNIMFKENTAYTIALYVNYLNSEFTRNIRLSFEYSDGTTYTPIYSKNPYSLKACFSSDPEKTLVAISSYSHIDTMFIRYMLTGFGIFEGVHTNYADVFESYDGERVEILLDAPLRRIGYSCDELDILEGKLRRKINTLHIDSSTAIAYSDTEGIFKIPLNMPMRAGAEFIAPLEKLTDTSESGICVSEDGRTLFLKAGADIIEAEDIVEYLKENAFDFTYVLATPTVSDIDISIPFRERESIIDIFSDVTPTKIVAEYV